MRPGSEREKQEAEAVSSMITHNTAQHRSGGECVATGGSECLAIYYLGRFHWLAGERPLNR
jgi:hypothetical protein